MKSENTIPIVIGVSGHRAIREKDRPALSAAVKTELKKLQGRCRHSRLVLLCSLAEGADLLCADAAEELGVPLIAALPREQADYEKDFSEEGLAGLRRHIARAEQVFVTPSTEPVPEGGADRDFQFRQAGIYVAAHSHVLLALWDGGPGTDSACGTAEAVDFALNGSYYPAEGVSLRSGCNEAVIHVFTPRGERTEEPAGTVHVLGNREAMLDVLKKTDDFNRQSASLKLETASRLPQQTDDRLLARMETISRAAGKLSGVNARRYRLALALLALASALLTFAFLMYDEAQAVWMILVCGFMLLAAWSCQRFAARSDCHRRYIEYRALAECLRVQTYLRYAGSGLQAADLLSWTQQEETAWIMDALCALSAGERPMTGHDIRVCWVEAQRDYHREAGKRSQSSLQLSERIVRTALFLSVGLYGAALLFELLCGGLIFAPRLPVNNVEIFRTILKILLGTISAVTLFVANYYGRLSLLRGLSDHGKMERFYGKMSDQLLRSGQTEALLTVLAREELIENGNWSYYQRDNKPDISV